MLVVSLKVCVCDAPAASYSPVLTRCAPVDSVDVVPDTVCVCDPSVLVVKV